MDRQDRDSQSLGHRSEGYVDRRLNTFATRHGSDHLPVEILALGDRWFRLSVSSGAYFPVELFPGWLEVIARSNPITIALTATREALMGGSVVSDLGSSLAISP